MAELGIGSRLDRYEILSLEAEGGMGRVYAARLHARHGFSRKVALKTIKPEYAEIPRFRTMLLDEARIASMIEHPNVVHIVDLGEHEGTLYIVMDWVDGMTLGRLCRSLETAGKRLPVGVALRVASDVAAGLHAAHELKGADGTLLDVVHRDVSPDNVLVSRAGYARLTDFGIAKARERIAEETTAGRFKGKPGYVAPEQAAGRRLTRGTDVWSLGAVIHRLLTGAPPFADLDALVAYINGGPAPDLPSNVPAALATVVRRALAVDPTKRHPTAAELNRALAAAAADSGGVATSDEVAALVRGVTDIVADDTVQADSSDRATAIKATIVEGAANADSPQIEVPTKKT